MQRLEGCSFCHGAGEDEDGEVCYLCLGNGELHTIAEMADQALKCQNACNGIALTGLMHRYCKILMHHHNMGTTGAFQHPACKLIFMHMTQLMGLPSIFDEYSAVSHECERLVWEAKKEDYETKEAVSNELH